MSLISENRVLFLPKCSQFGKKAASRLGGRAGEDRLGRCHFIPKGKGPSIVIGHYMEAYSYIEQYYLQRLLANNRYRPIS